jgi:hypothetical protein
MHWEKPMSTHLPRAVAMGAIIAAVIAIGAVPAAAQSEAVAVDVHGPRTINPISPNMPAWRVSAPADSALVEYQTYIDGEWLQSEFMHGSEYHPLYSFWAWPNLLYPYAGQRVGLQVRACAEVMILPDTDYLDGRGLREQRGDRDPDPVATRLGLRGRWDHLSDRQGSQPPLGRGRAASVPVLG